jgi:hypothetical protein
MVKLNSYLDSYLPDEKCEFGWAVVPSTPSSFLQTVRWMNNPKIVEKELTEKQLFNNVEKELIDVINRTSAI